MNVASQSTWVNPGDDYTANCNIPGLKPSDYLSQLRVEWFHNGLQLTSLCEILLDELAQKYSCKVLAPKFNNISLLLTVKSNCGFNTLVISSDQCFEKEVAVQFKWIQVHWFKFDRCFHTCSIFFSSLYEALQYLNSFI